MISRKNQEEFESLGVEAVAKPVSVSMWSEAKAREARTWLSSQENRTIRKLKTQIVAASAAVTATIIGLILRK